VLTYPPDPCVVHPLPQAPHFVGRESELETLRACWQNGFRGVLALVGLGGAGKTAVTARFIDELLGPGGASRPDGLFIWSFYQQPDAGLFLQEAYRYFTRGAALDTSAKGIGILHFLHDAFASGGPHLLVLDGLERVQRQENTASYGRIEDPLLKGFLVRLAEGIGRTITLVTSRFPLTDLASLPCYRSLDLGGLDSAAARDLLRGRGVKGDEAVLAQLIDSYGAHALTLDHLGGVIGQFLGGDVRRAPEAPAFSTPGADRQALRLARLLRAYEEHLPAPELALLCRLCLLRRSVTEDQVAQLFLCSPAVHARTARDAFNLISRLPATKQDQASEIEDFAQAVRECLEEALVLAPVAGPEDSFRNQVLAIVENARSVGHTNDDAGFAKLARSFGTSGHDIQSDMLVELARLYAAPEPNVLTDERPLGSKDRHYLRELCARYLELRADPLMPFNEKVDSTLEQAFQHLGWKKKAHWPIGDLTPGDLLSSYTRVRQRLLKLAGKHFALRCIRKLCAFYQRKWSLSGELATLNAAGLHRVLDTLVGRRLAIREADGSFSIHPAIRDYFYRLAVTQQQGGWHDLLREQMISLIQQPGQRNPQDPATLDLVEEAIYHAQQASRNDEATWLYREVLGGMRHLAWKLGEMARGLRILRSFDPCPDRDALAWFLRALGEFDEAYTQNMMSYFRADVRLLQGRLTEVAAEGDDARSAVAAFLMGKAKRLPPDLLGCAVPRVQLLLYLGRLEVARRAAGMEALYQHIGWEADRARHLLFLAEVARRQADLVGSRKHLDAAATWILHSGSVEHLCLLHLIQARLALDAEDRAAARGAIDEGLHLAHRCGLRLYRIELLCQQAEVCLADANVADAETAAREALQSCSAPHCQFVWGAAEAGHLLGQALAARGDKSAAQAALRNALDLRRRLDDPKTGSTERLLLQIGAKKK
jgi:hypothetical protein